jgi:quercetin dioxygenase-like cupin family protein
MTPVEKEENMATLNEISPFPNPGVRLVKEDEHVAIWEETFEPGKPTPPHRHMRDYVAIFLHAGELTITPLAGEAEEYTVIAGELATEPRDGATHLVWGPGMIVHSHVPADGVGHSAVNEGSKPALMILIEIKGTATGNSV